MPGPIETAFVEIKSRVSRDFADDITKRVDAAMKRIERRTENAFDPLTEAAAEAGRDVKRSMDRIERDVSRNLEARIDVDLDDGLVAERLEALTEDLHATVDVALDTDRVDRGIADLETRIAAAKAQIAEAITLDVDADTSGARRQLVRLERNLRTLRDARVHVDVDVDTDRATGALGLFRRALDGALGGDGRGGGISRTLNGIGGAFSSVASTVAGATASIGKLVGKLGGLSAAAIPAIAALTAVGGAVALSAGSLLTASAAASSLGLAFAAVKIGSIGVSDAFEAQAEAQAELAATGEISAETQDKLDAAMKRLDPSARAVLTTISKLSPAYAELRRNVQGALFEQQAANISKLDAAFRPLIDKTLTRAATILNKAADGVTRFLTSGEGRTALSTLLNGLNDTLAKLLPGIGAFGRGLLTLFAGTVGESSKLAQSFTDLGNRFAAFADRITESGRFADFLDRASKAAGALLSVVGGIGRVLAGVFGAGAERGVGLLDSLATSLNGMADSLKSVEGQNALAAFFSTIDIAAEHLSNSLNTIKPVVLGIASVVAALIAPVQNLLTAVAPLAKALGEALGRVLTDAAPLIGGLANTIVTSLVPVLELVATDLLPSLESALERVLPAVADALGQIVPVAADLLAAIIPIAAEILDSLAPALAELVEAVGPLVAEIGGALVPLFEDLGPVVAVVAPIIAGVVKGFAKLVKALTPVIAKILAVTVYLSPTGLLPLGFKAVTKGAALVGDAIAAVGDAFGSAADAIGDAAKDVAGFLSALASKVAAFAADTSRLFQSLPGKIAAALSTLAGAVGRVFTFLFASVTRIVTDGLAKVVAFHAALPGRVAGALRSLGSTVSRVFRGAFASAGNVVADAVDSIVRKVTALPGKISALGSKMKEAGRSIISQLLAGLGKVGSGAADFAAGIGRAVTDVINAGIRKLNSVLKIKVDPPGPGSFTIDPPDIPQISAFAKGGIVDAATLALIGEAGREVVIPLQRGSAEIADLLSRSGALNRLNEREFLALVEPRLARIASTVDLTRGRLAGLAPSPDLRSVAIARAAGQAPTTETGRVISREVRPLAGTSIDKSRTIEQTNHFTLLATIDPQQQAEQIAVRLSDLMSR